MEKEMATLNVCPVECGLTNGAGGGVAEQIGSQHDARKARESTNMYDRWGLLEIDWE